MTHSATRLRYSELEYWRKDGHWLCQYKPELWREGYAASTFGVSSHEAELLDDIVRYMKQAYRAEEERKARAEEVGRYMMALNLATTERDAARAQVAAMEAVLREVAHSGVEADYRKYLTVQIDPVTWRDVQQYAALPTPTPQPEQDDA